MDLLEKEEFESLVDIGCGDGRFLCEMARLYPNKHLTGVDYSERAIQLANAMNPDIDYKQTNIVEHHLPEKFEVATLIEVLEHIPPRQVDEFLRGCAEALQEGGKIILTVPHLNRVLESKHYQHFDSGMLRSVLNPYFTDLVFFPFEPPSRVINGLHRLLGGSGKHFVITNRALLSWFFRLYRSRYVYSPDESGGTRIAVVGRKK
jgi:SAM-dependent methyltransferase